MVSLSHLSPDMRDILQPQLRARQAETKVQVAQSAEAAAGPWWADFSRRLGFQAGLWEFLGVLGRASGAGRREEDVTPSLFLSACQGIHSCATLIKLLSPLSLQRLVQTVRGLKF